MVQAEADLNGSGLAARLVLQIHDELLIEAPKGEAGRAGEIVLRAMVGAFDLDPPLVVDVGSGETWLEAK
jgi:DNA polymerase-1